MNEENKETIIDTANKSINSEKLKEINRSKAQSVIQKRSHSVSNINKTKIQPNLLKHTDDNRFFINIQDIIKEVMTDKTTNKDKDRNMEKTINIAKSQEINHKQIPAKESPRFNNKNEGGSYLHHTIQRIKTEASNKEKINTKYKDQSDQKNHCYRLCSTQQNMTRSNHSHVYKGEIRTWNQMQLSDVFKAQNMNGDLIDHMMLFRKRNDNPLLIKDNKPIGIVNKSKDESPYKIEINLIPKNNHSNSNSDSRSQSKENQKEEHKTKNYKSFIPLNIGKLFIERKNSIIQSILGTKEYDKLFVNKRNELITLIDENDETKKQKLKESDLDIDDNKDLNISNIDDKSNQKNNNSIFNLTRFNSKQSESYYKKYNLIECRLKSPKAVS